MDNPGTYSLGSQSVTTALTGQVITSAPSQVLDGNPNQPYIDGLAGMAAVALFANFAYGSGGTTLDVRVQTSLDQGNTWIDIARFNFTTASRQAACNIAGAAQGVATVAALAAEGVYDGPLGDRLRAVVDSTGTYGAGTQITVTATPR